MSKETSKDQREVQAAKDEEATDFPAELNEARWSVVTFEKRVAHGLTYEAAFRKMAKLGDEGQFGLCILTDEAAARITKRSKR